MYSQNTIEPENFKSDPANPLIACQSLRKKVFLGNLFNGSHCRKSGCEILKFIGHYELETADRLALYLLWMKRVALHIHVIQLPTSIHQNPVCYDWPSGPSRPGIQRLRHDKLPSERDHGVE